jgi:hypothetical protein
MEPITDMEAHLITDAAPAAEDIKAKPTTSWRDLIKVHPAADAFPMLPEEELDALAEDIKANGLTDPVTTWVDNDGTEWLLDGRNRLDAMALAGYRFKRQGQLIGSGPNKGQREPERFKVLPLNGSSKWAGAYVGRYFGTDPYAFVISANIHRRHLATEDRKLIAVVLLKANPQRSNRAIADEVQLDKNTVAQVRKDAEARGEIHHVETRVDSKGRAQPAAKLKKAKKPAGEPMPATEEPQAPALAKVTPTEPAVTPANGPQSEAPKPANEPSGSTPGDVLLDTFHKLTPAEQVTTMQLFWDVLADWQKQQLREHVTAELPMSKLLADRWPSMSGRDKQDVQCFAAAEMAKFETVNRPAAPAAQNGAATGIATS